MLTRRQRITDRLLTGADLLVDFATLGEYGIERCPAGEARREQTGCDAGWEAFASRPRGDHPTWEFPARPGAPTGVRCRLVSARAR